MAFEVFDKRSAPMQGTPSVTLQKRGILSINAAAHALIGKADVVELLFDAERRVMALRPAAPSPTAYQVRGPSKTGQVLLSVTAFTHAFGIDTEDSRRYEPFVEDGMLCIDLNGPSTVIRGNRSKDTDPQQTEGEE
jgi:hypothetical protein